MKKIYAARDTMEAAFVRSLLEEQEIAAVVQGESLGIARGSLPYTIETLPSIWVNEEDVERALAVIKQMEAKRGQTEPRDSWHCSGCGEWIESQFTHCWRCGLPREGSEEPQPVIPLSAGGTLDYASPVPMDTEPDFFRLLQSAGIELTSVSPTIAVPDPRKTAEYYRDQLDFAIETAPDDPSERIIVRRGGVRLCFIPGQMAAGAQLDITVKDVDALHKECRLAELDLRKEIRNKSWEVSEFQVRDPNGLILHFREG